MIPQQDARIHAPPPDIQTHSRIRFVGAGVGRTDHRCGVAAAGGGGVLRRRGAGARCFEPHEQHIAHSGGVGVRAGEEPGAGAGGVEDGQLGGVEVVDGVGEFLAGGGGSRVCSHVLRGCGLLAGTFVQEVAFCRCWLCRRGNGVGDDLLTIVDSGRFGSSRGGGGGARLETAETVERHRVVDCRRRELRKMDFQQLTGRIVGAADAIIKKMVVQPTSCCRCWGEVLAVRLII